MSNTGAQMVADTLLLKSGVAAWNTHSRVAVATSGGLHHVADMPHMLPPGARTDQGCLSTPTLPHEKCLLHSC